MKSFSATKYIVPDWAIDFGTSEAPKSIRLKGEFTVGFRWSATGKGYLLIEGPNKISRILPCLSKNGKTLFLRMSKPMDKVYSSVEPTFEEYNI